MLPLGKSKLLQQWYQYLETQTLFDENTSQAITKCGNRMTEVESCSRDVSLSMNCV